MEKNLTVRRDTTVLLRRQNQTLFSKKYIEDWLPFQDFVFILWSTQRHRAHPRQSLKTTARS